MRPLGGPPGIKNEENMYPGGPPKCLIDPAFTLYDGYDKCPPTTPPESVFFLQIAPLISNYFLTFLLENKTKKVKKVPCVRGEI